MVEHQADGVGYECCDCMAAFVGGADFVAHFGVCCGKMVERRLMVDCGGLCGNF